MTVKSGASLAPLQVLNASVIHQIRCATPLHKTYCCPLDPLEWLNTARRREIKSSRKPKLDALKWLFPHHHNQDDTIDFYQG
ncbi:MAG: hypothetical protein RIG63_22450 [Coleofasciculus chthonoplastes F3-SA18-01]